jgi:hypothetical protein
MSTSNTLFIHNGYKIKGSCRIDNSNIVILYMVKNGGRLLETARFDLKTGALTDFPYGKFSLENFRILKNTIKNVIRK